MLEKQYSVGYSNETIECIKYNAEIEIILKTKRKVTSTSWKTLTTEVHITQPGGNLCA